MKSCGSCTECCQGWVTGSANDVHFYPGVPCAFLECTGCGIYEKRPIDPCRTFKCEWLANKDFPAWMRPDKIKAIIMHKQIDGINYYELVECGQKLDSSVLEFFLTKYITGEYENIRYRIHGHPRSIGTQDFINSIEGK